MRVYYSKKMVADSGSFSPSAAKPAEVIKDWIEHGIDVDIKEPVALSKHDLYLAHNSIYVDEVLNCETHNGFGNRSKEVAATLKYTTASMYWAAVHAIKTQSVAAALCSGFHHAGWDHGGGFCTFNGLMIAAIKLIKQGYAKRVGILDLDNHYGNGTDDIIRKLKLTKKIKHFTAGSTFGSPKDVKWFLKNLSQTIEDYFKDCDVVIAQLGADPLLGDPLGGWMTVDEMRERDKIVFDTCKRFGIPLAWNLAGGYLKDKDGTIKPVLEVHRNSAIECNNTYGEIYYESTG